MTAEPIPEAIFDEKSLLDAVTRIWGPAGAHVDVLRDLIAQRDRLTAVIAQHRLEVYGMRDNASGMVAYDRRLYAALNAAR